MLWCLLWIVAWGLHTFRWVSFGRPRYPLQIVPPKMDLLVEVFELFVGVLLMISFVLASHHPRVQPVRILCFLLTVFYHVLVTIWGRVWWRARLWNSLVVLGYCSCLWWLLLIYKDSDYVPLVMTFFAAALKTTDVWLVRNT